MAKMQIEKKIDEVEIIEKKKSKKDKDKKKDKKEKKRKIEENLTESLAVANGAVSDNEDSKVKDKKKKEKKDKKKKKSKDSTSNTENADQPERNGSANEVTEELEDVVEKSQIEIDGDFSNFNISQETVEKLNARGVKYLFPIQAQTYNHVFEGTDVLAQARTGTGKTFSFAIPLIEKLKDNPQTKVRGRLPKVIALAPTRELAKQVADDFQCLTDCLSVLCVYGGTPYSPQESAIRRGVDIVVGTPGRLLDFLNKGTLKLTEVAHCVLDEVDHMLDMGFAEDVEAILKFAYDREGSADPPQTLLFSATMPDWVFKTAQKYMKPDCQKIDLVGKEGIQTANNVQHFAIKCGYHERASTIGDMIQVYSGNMGRAIVFCQTKKDADELCMGSGIKLETHVMHGDIPQEKREKVLKKFREGRYKCLVTTDVAARGLDIPEVDLVIQCSPPKDVDAYIHRSGRTGRAGRSGTCVCFFKPQEEYDLRRVENRAGMKFKRIGPPTAEEIIKAAALDAARSIEAVSTETLSNFQASAEKLIEEKGAVNALSAALALISGSTDVKNRSLLSSKKGFTAYLFKTTVEMRGLGYAWRGLARHIPEDTKEKITGMKLCADKMGCVFDLPSECDSIIEDHWQDGQYDTLTKATELPELVEYENFNSPRGHSGWGGGRGGGGRRGGGGGRFGGERRGGYRRGGFGDRGNRGMKRSFNGNSSFGGQAKRTKFDD